MIDRSTKRTAMPYHAPEAHLGSHYRSATEMEEFNIIIQNSSINAEHCVFVTDDPQADVPWIALDRASNKIFKTGYSEQYQAFSDAVRYQRLMALHAAYPKIWGRIRRDIGGPLPDSEAALAFYLMILTGMRVGGEKGRREFQSSGVTNLLTRDCCFEEDGRTVQIGVSSELEVGHDFTIEDEILYQWVRARKKDGQERLFDLDAEAIKKYLDEISDGQLSLYLFRAYHATALAVHWILKNGGMPTEEIAGARFQEEVCDKVAYRLSSYATACHGEYIAYCVWQMGLAGFEWPPKPDCSRVIAKYASRPAPATFEEVQGLKVPELLTSAHLDYTPLSGSAHPKQANATPHLEEALQLIPETMVDGLSPRDLHRAFDAFVNFAKDHLPDLPEDYYRYPTTYEVDRDERADEEDEASWREIQEEQEREDESDEEDEEELD